MPAERHDLVRWPSESDQMSSSEPLFGAIYGADRSADELMAVAREFSPRTASQPGGEVVMDLAGLTRLFGERHQIAAEIRRTAADRGWGARVAIADGGTTARLLVHYRPGVTVLDAQADGEALAPLKVDALGVLGTPAVRD